MPPSNIAYQARSNATARRIRVWYGVLVIVCGLFIVRLFYIQVIRHDQYRKAAILSQLKEYEIPAPRGVIEAHDGAQVVPIVLNETLYTLFADPVYIKDPSAAALAVAATVGGEAETYNQKMTEDNRYVVLAKKLNKDQKAQIEALGLKGVGVREESYRTYPQGSLAAQLLGFVNDEGKGTYGVEQALDAELRGTPGRLKAITDARGVPLVSSEDNIVNQPLSGKKVLLTIDVAMQRQLEDILKAGLEAAKAPSGGALILDPNSGAVKAMANFPTYQPAEFFKLEDPSVFNNSIVSAPLEIGSVMKPLTAAAAMDLGKVGRSASFHDPGFYKVDGYTITNIEEHAGSGTRSLSDILQMSLNTGATWLLMQMGGGEINERARVSWHDYMTNHYQFGKLSGIEQGYESGGTVPDPKDGFGLNIQYANTAFGQGMTATPLQLGAAVASLINGGTYFRPQVVDGYIDDQGKFADKGPEVIRAEVVKASVAKDIKELMEYVMTKNHQVYGLKTLRPEFSVGGKTGTAQISKPEGGYHEDRFNGVFVGFLGGDKPQYVIVVRVNEPQIKRYAGSGAAAPIFSNLVSMLINNFPVTPRGQ